MEVAGSSPVTPTAAFFFLNSTTLEDVYGRTERSGSSVTFVVGKVESQEVV